MSTQSVKRRRLFRVIVGIFGLVLLCTSAALAQGKIKIGVILQNNAPVFLQGVDGLKKGFAEKGYGEDKVEFIIIDAKNNLEAIKDIVAELRNANVKFIAPLGTAGTIETLKHVKDIPVVFPVVGYAESIIEAGKKFGYGNNYTGAVTSVSADRILEVALKIKRDIGKAGMIYDSTADNSRRDKDNFEKSCAKFGIEMLALPFTQDSEVVPTFQKLVDQGVKCVMIPKDSVQQRHVDELRSIIYKNQLFSITSEVAVVPSGASVVGLSCEPYECGRLAAEKIVQILNGRKPADIPMEAPKSYAIWLNMIAAKKTNIEISAVVMKLATKVITE